MKQVVYILGTPYEIVDESEVNNKVKLQSHDGIAELYAKKIVINLSQVGEPNNYDNEKDYFRKVLRHEMVHAFFHESGLSHYCEDETLVDFLALQLDKMWEIMNPETLDDYVNGLGFKLRLAEKEGE